MLARLQQGLTLIWLAAVLAWLWFTLGRGQPGLAAVGMLSLCLAHAAVLALEFCWMHRQNGHDAAPRATTRQLIQAWWQESLHAPRVFCWQQPFRSRVHADRLGRTGQRGVLLIHGFVCNRGLWNPWLQRLHDEQHPVIALNLTPLFGSITAYRGLIDDAVRALTLSTGLPPVVVAHSMGGLAARAWWTLPGNTARIAHLITLGTPHRGTWLARWALSGNAREMREGSPWLVELGRSEPATHAARMTCYYSHCDNIVFPASNATVPGADNRHLVGVAHVAMVWRPEPLADLMQRLRA